MTDDDKLKQVLTLAYRIREDLAQAVPPAAEAINELALLLEAQGEALENARHRVDEVEAKNLELFVHINDASDKIVKLESEAAEHRSQLAEERGKVGILKSLNSGLMRELESRDGWAKTQKGADHD